MHHFGPKKYQLRDHLVGLLIRAFGNFSYARTVQLFDLLGMKCPSKSTLHYNAKKLDANFWQKILNATCGISYLIAMDGTGLSRSMPSYHYLKRIDGKMPKVPIKLSVAFNTRKKKFAAAKIRVRPAHDTKDAKYLLKYSNPQIAVADKGYVSEKIYEFAYQNNTLLMIPKKSNAKRGYYRKKMHKQYRLKTYHRRELVESGNSSIKRKYGSSVSSRTVRTIRTEIYARLACHNITGWLNRLLGQSPSLGIVLKKNSGYPSQWNQRVLMISYPSLFHF